MPDLDRVERVLLPGWRPVYKLVKGGHPTEEIAKRLLKALAAILRDRGGVPNLAECVEQVERHDAGLLDDRRFAAVLDHIEHRHASRHGKLLVRAALTPDVFGSDGFLRGPARERLCRQFLIKLVEQGLFAHQRSHLIKRGRPFASFSQAIEYETRLLALVRQEITELARRLAKDPTARSLRAPAFKLSKTLTTRELVDAPIT